jgi:uncharacterized damage-inducible protein DinB
MLSREPEVVMKKLLVLLFAIAATGMFAQEAGLRSKSPVMDALRQSMQRAQKNITAAAEAMPADKFSYKPTEKQMSFGKLATHIVEGNEYFCSRLADREEPKQGAEPKETESKDKLVGAIRKSFDYCSSGLANLDDSKLGQEVKVFGGRTVTKAAVVLMLAGSWSDHYGMEAQYLRLNGLTPPTAKEKD